MTSVLVPDAVATVRAALERIAATNGRLNALVLVDAGRALAAAERADRAAAAGTSLGALHGLPITLKDNIAVAGQRTTNGSAFWADHVAEADAEVTRRLVGAGAIVLGKANLHELAFGATTQNMTLGSCRNPWDLARIPGGSSGGSGAAVAACYGAASFGSDTGGSGRVPAAANGILGLRPTFGRISNRGVFPLSPRFDTVSPMARDAHHLAAILDVLTGYDPLDPWSASRPADAPTPPADARALRIGIPRRFFFDDVAPDILAAVEAAIAELVRLGLAVVEIELPGAETTQATMTTLLLTDAAATHRARMEAAPERFDPESLRRLRMGLATPGVDYADALTATAHWQRVLAGTFTHVDVVLTPMLAGLTPRIADSADLVAATRAMTRFSYAWSLGQGPALSVPCGFGADGMPVAFQIAAAPWNDEAAIALAALYQSATDWHRALPPLIR